ncbi:hypothetical protein NFHSH190041_23820 [Shewanella sp. NFH-SH190041]|nr:hypothetical protein NFHSH190041_23820 [Shewanella sp. NFH-SH190041]
MIYMLSCISFLHELSQRMNLGSYYYIRTLLPNDTLNRVLFIFIVAWYISSIYIVDQSKNK